MSDERAKEIAEIADMLADEPPPSNLTEMIAEATRRHHTFTHDRGDPARWEQVVDMVYQGRNAVIGRGCDTTAVMIDRGERRHLIAWLSRTHAGLGGYYQHGGMGFEPGGDDHLFGMPVFWAAPGSMDGQTVRVMTDFSRRS